MKKFILGLDVGIGSVGWAVLNLDKLRIEDCGARIFESGEDPKKRERKSQQRRRDRGLRRLTGRRSYRKVRLKKHLELIGLVKASDIKLYYETKENDAVSLRYKALSEKLSPEELAACLIHICNNRGYKDFYEVNTDDLTKEELKEYEKEKGAAGRIERIMAEGGYRTPAEMICKDNEFACDNSSYRKFHNTAGNGTTNLISRKMLEKEVDLILDKQREYYACLTENNIEIIHRIIFDQRDFEDGPGNANDPYRKYTGYLDKIDKCRFYKDEDRGARFTLLSDVYSLVNVLSQYSYTDSSGDPCLKREFAEELIFAVLNTGSINKSDLKKIAKKHGITVNGNENSNTPITKCLKYIKIVKPIFEDFGYNWSELIENYSDIDNNLLNRIGVVLSESQTPQRRINKLKELAASLDDKLISKLALQKFSGTCNVSYKYMNGAVLAFLEGDIYGKYQADFIKDIPVADEASKPAKLPPFKSEEDCEFFKNPVVFRSINETRKIINAIIDRYGYPCSVNIETADELNKSFDERSADDKRNRDNEKENDRIINKIIEKTGYSVETARRYIERYKLWETQGHKCLYSNDDLKIEDVLNDRSHVLEVDHIVPYSLILDNTINNKALVYTTENQTKGQRTPLMYMNKEKAEKFKTAVNDMLRNKKCSRKKYNYLMLENFDDLSLLDEWKSRNLNDTRYISKYLVNYLKTNLRFNTSGELPEDVNIKNNSRVFAVKSAFTSRFRMQWLNQKTWGRYDKSELKKITYLDHAADAIVIANCRPEYVILAGEKIKLSKIYKNAQKRITPEYTASMENCVESLYKYYRMDREKSRRILRSPSARIAPIIPGLALETDNRLRDLNTHRELFDKNASDEEIIEVFNATNRDIYSDDPDFAASLRMPVISIKPERVYTGEITAQNPISVREIDGVKKQLSRKDIGKLEAKDIPNIRTDDTDLIDSLRSVLEGKKDKYTVGEYFKENDLPYFTTAKGRRINKVTVISTPPARTLKKEISENNYSILDDRSYYCVEIYKDSKNQTNVQGIALSDLVKKNGKLWLKPDFKMPNDYAAHVMYLFPGDYIRIYKSENNIKFEGYYKSVNNINEPSFGFISNNKIFDSKKRISIAKKDKIIKLSVDILGKITGENNGDGIRCGEQLSLLREKN